jgi:hypothetical protein
MKLEYTLESRVVCEGRNGFKTDPVMLLAQLLETEQDEAPNEDRLMI